MKNRKFRLITNMWKLLFQRVTMVCLSILGQLAFFVLLIWRFQEVSQWLYFCLLILSSAVVLFIISKNTNPAYKIAWVIPILTFPIFGGLFYLLLGGNRLSSRQRKKMLSVEENQRRHLPL